MMNEKLVTLPEIEKIDDFFAQDLKLMSLATNYLDWQVKIVTPYLGGVQLEIGAGIGNFTSHLPKNSTKHIAIEPDPYCFDKLTHAIQGDEKIQAINISSEQLFQQNLLPQHFDTIIALNVLEHIEDDLNAIQSWSNLLSDNGKIILLVPAGEYLYGSIDKKLRHYRRYSRTRIQKLSMVANLKINKFSYMNSIGMIAWFWNNRIMKCAEQNSSQIFIFDKFIVPWLQCIENFTPPPFGQSIFTVLNKK